MKSVFSSENFKKEELEAVSALAEQTIKTLSRYLTKCDQIPVFDKKSSKS